MDELDMESRFSRILAGRWRDGAWALLIIAMAAFSRSDSTGPEKLVEKDVYGKQKVPDLFRASTRAS
jgi:hypothetical protein